MYSEFEVKKQICEIGKRIYNNGFVAANDGNISVKISDNEFLCTPTGVSKGFMTPDMICKVNAKGEVLAASGKYKPSSEIKMHLRVYAERPDVKSVVHAHPPYATSFAIAGIPLNKPIMPEAVIALGCVPIAEYGTPSTEEIPDAVAKYLDNYDAVLLENHGALSWGGDLISAYYKMESLEFYAKLTFISTLLGGPKELSEDQVQTLYGIRKKLGVAGRHPADLCKTVGCSVPCSNAEEKSCGCDSKKEEPAKDTAKLVEEITKKVLSQLNL
ncbi:class II aldolase/adducin family protein [Clostridium sp. SYSU_GA19001]|uniref:class II aldolase/adducin family protein n=1 Tax=Clostridium caldaquaticum TaxID=2940653 RepID=UPI0020777F88|nr:class II aldolase/adducin family protein [Clostridium caldaquaticum]MCM8710034.1 class II aldolase/adducin family protein [Clostridium caldaquaticum]